MDFRVGEWVTWTSQARGVQTEKCGEVVAVVPPHVAAERAYPAIKSGDSAWGGGWPRSHVSYVVKVGTKLYWPRVKNLQLATPPEPHEPEKPQWPAWMFE